MDPLVSADPALYDPSSFGTLTDQMLGAPDASSIITGSTSGVTNVLGSVGSGLQAITGLLDVVAKVVPSIEQGITDALSHGLGPAIKNVLAFEGKVVSFISPPIGGVITDISNVPLPTSGNTSQDGANLWQWFSDHSFGEFYTAMLELGLGVDTSKFDDQANAGRQTVDKMLGFAFLIQFLVPAMGLLGKLPLAGRWVEAALEPLARIPEEMGLSWAMGITVEESFKTAVGMSIEEGINRQKRGNRIGWPQLRTLLKQHVLADLSIDSQGKLSGTVPKTTTVPGEAVLRGLLENQGFPDQQIDLLLALSDQLLPVGDLQQLYLRGEMSIDEVGSYVTKLGFNDQDRDRLVGLYVSKAETEASVTLRTTARTLYENQLIGETQYRDILTEANYPQREIDADVQAIKLVQQYGRTQATIGTIKARLLHHQISGDEAVTELHRLNLADTYITELIQLWQAPPIHKPHGLTQAQVLKYMVSGLITPTSAYDRLVELGVNEADARFLVDHPTASNGVHQYKLTPGIVTQAYIDGAISQTDLSDAYTKVGVTADALQTYIQQALYKKAHHRGSDNYVAPLPDNKIVDAYKYGLFDYQTALQRLQENGHSQADALLYLEIENKGPIQTGVGQAFSTLNDALAFLTLAGWTLIPPPSPLILEAEAMAAAAGYALVPPVPKQPTAP